VAGSGNLHRRVVDLPVTAATAYFQGFGRRRKSEAIANEGLFTWNNLRNAAVAAYSANRLMTETLDWLDKYLGPAE